MPPLQVPYYEQSLDYTCGPASLMMAMAYFDRSLPLDQATEVEIWREATWVEPRGCSMYGLGIAAHRRGFRVRLQTNLEDDALLYQTVKERRPELDVEVMQFFQEHLRQRCHAAGIVEARREVTLDDLRGALGRGEVPLLLTSTAVTARDDIPHWIVVRGLEDGTVHINNPYIEDGANVQEVPTERLEQFLGFRGWQGLVAISPAKNSPPSVGPRRRRSA